METKWHKTPAFKIALTGVLITGGFGLMYAIIPLVFQKPSDSQSPIVIRGGEGGKAVGAGGGAGVAIGTAGEIDMRGGEGGRIVVFGGTDGQALGAGGGGPVVLEESTNPIPITGKGEDGGYSEFGGIRAEGGTGGQGLDGGSGGEIIYGRMHLRSGEVYRVKVGQGGKAMPAGTLTNGNVFSGGDGASGAVVVRVRIDGNTNEFDDATAIADMLNAANQTMEPTGDTRAGDFGEGRR